MAKRFYGLASAAPSNKSVRFWVEVKPLAVLKQIATMFCSACGPGLIRAHTGLPRFLLNRETRDLPPKLSFYLALFDVNNSEAVRQSGLSGLADFSTGAVDVVSEICFPPFIIVMSASGRPREPRLFDITWFSNYGIAQKADIAFELHTMPVNSFFPMDYRTGLEIDRAAKGAHGR